MMISQLTDKILFCVSGCGDGTVRGRVFLCISVCAVGVLHACMPATVISGPLNYKHESFPGNEIGLVREIKLKGALSHSFSLN